MRNGMNGAGMGSRGGIPLPFVSVVVITAKWFW
jgi:hypothetical protein